jgi:hypothetical protein
MPAPHINPAHKGLLHKEMGVPQGKKINVGDLMAEKAKAKRTGNSTLMKQANFAIVARGWKHRKAA